jgi:hypothetical protein
MKAKYKIIQALAAKNWEVREYEHESVRHGNEGREGGYQVDVEIEDYPEVWPQNALTDALVDTYGQVWDQVDAQTGDRGIDCSQGCIVAYTLADVLWVIEQIPDRLTIPVTVV